VQQRAWEFQRMCGKLEAMADAANFTNKTAS